MNSNFESNQNKEKPRIKGSIISRDQAREIAADWHGGQWSALYSLQSTGFFIDDQQKYLDEINECLTQAESSTQKNQLEKLKRWVLFKGEKLTENEIWQTSEKTFPDNLSPFRQAHEDHFDQLNNLNKEDRSPGS